MQPTVRVRDAARLLHVTPRTVRNWIAAGKLPAARVSERVTLVSLAEIERMAGAVSRPDLSSTRAGRVAVPALRRAPHR
jgi:excisionase family DNA binding protein